MESRLDTSLENIVLSYNLILFTLGHPEDVDADGCYVGHQEFLHHYRHVPAHVVLRLRWRDLIWYSQARI